MMQQASPPLGFTLALTHPSTYLTLQKNRFEGLCSRDPIQANGEPMTPGHCHSEATTTCIPTTAMFACGDLWVANTRLAYSTR